jgi:ABC-type bacteriocin/lantibiotic exporter with double-glycine peptidase domain
LIAIAILAVLGLIATRLTPIVSAAAMLIVLALVIVISIRTPRRAIESAARLHIDTVASRRFGPLLDQRGLLTDELAWERATGRLDQAAKTERELRAINALLQSTSARPSR